MSSGFGESVKEYQEMQDHALAIYNWKHPARFGPLHKMMPEDVHEIQIRLTAIQNMLNNEQASIHVSKAEFVSMLQKLGKIYELLELGSK